MILLSKIDNNQTMLIIIIMYERNKRNKKEINFLTFIFHSFDYLLFRYKQQQRYHFKFLKLKTPHFIALKFRLFLFSFSVSMNIGYLTLFSFWQIPRVTAELFFCDLV